MWLRNILLFIAAKHFVLLYTDADNPKGHLKPIGFQGTCLGNITEMKYSPRGGYFYEHFIKPRRPLVIRNAANHWLAIRNWPNETYLNEMYGDVPFTVDMRKVFDSTVGVRKDLNLSDFLKIYKEQPVYLDSAFPPTNMMNEISLPPILQCGEIVSKISSVYLLMSSGNTSSALHHDGYENILTVVSGSKKVLLFNTSYSEHVYGDAFTVLPGLSPIDPSNVDLQKYPKFADVSFFECTLNAGDILYIPQYWWHHVISYDTPNIAANIWFEMFDYEEEFEKANLKEDVDVIKVTELFDRLVLKEPSQITCKEQSPPLDQVLNVVLEDASSESLRIPKISKRPPDFKLASGYTMPPLGFGTAALHPSDTLPAIVSALQSGYRLFDTAQIYGTEAAVGEAIRMSNIPRSDFTIVTKLHPQYHGYDSTISSVESSMNNLQTDYIDVFLIHTKECNAGYFKCPEGSPRGTWQDSWRAMELLNKQGKIHSVGVSNFDVMDLKELLNITTVPVSVIQNWFDPFHQDANVRQFCAKHGIHYMGYSTLGSQWTTYGGMDSNPVLTSVTFFEIASHYEFVVPQVILRWAMHLNVTVIPRSRDSRHILLNFKSLDIELTANEIQTISDDWLANKSEESTDNADEDTEEDVVGLGTSTGAREEDREQDEDLGEEGYTRDTQGLERSDEAEDPEKRIKEEL